MLRHTLPALLLGALALGLASPASAQSTDPSFRLVNNTRHVVQEVFASPSNERNWGQNRLGTESIAAGANHIVRLAPGPCENDLRIVYQGGLAEERRRINTCALVDLPLPLVTNAPAGAVPPSPRPAQPPQAQPAQPTQPTQPIPPQAQAPARPPATAPTQAPGPQQGNPSFNLVNQSSRVIDEFYASPASARDWGQDRLGNEVVQPGANFAVRLPQGECVYDLRAVFQGGGNQERRGVNTCTLDNYIVR